MCATAVSGFSGPSGCTLPGEMPGSVSGSSVSSITEGGRKVADHTFLFSFLFFLFFFDQRNALRVSSAMAEKYMKDIMEKLEEIEKLHTKLRGMVPRMRSHEAGSSASQDRKTSKPKKKKKDPAANKERKRKSLPKQKVSEMGIDMERERSSRGTKYLKRLRNSSVSYVTDTSKRIKNFLNDLFERDMILVSRAAQTLDDGAPEATSSEQPTGNENNEFPWKEMRYKKNRASMREQLKRLIEHFNYTQDSSPQTGSRVSIHDDNSGIHEPRRVRKQSSLLPADEETSRILSAARSVSVDDNERNSDLGSQVRDFVRKYSPHLH
ncbi:uncharacterized protein LOC144474461 [Augochlora pura]